MRIALSGPAGAGKTTLANRLSAKLELPVIAEALAPVHSTMLAYRRAPSGAALALWKASYFQWCEDRARAYTEHRGGFIADRWELDAFGLWLHAFVQYDTMDETRRLREIFCNQARSMDLVVVLPVAEFPFGDRNEDGLRRNKAYNRGLLTQLSFTGMLSLIPASVERYAPSRVEPVEKRLADILAMASAYGMP